MKFTVYYSKTPAHLQQNLSQQSEKAEIVYTLRDMISAGYCNYVNYNMLSILRILYYVYFFATILSLSLYMCFAGITPRTQEVG